MRFDRMTTGFGSFKEEQEKEDKARESKRGKLFRFYPPGDEEEVTIRFLHDEPLVWREHDIKENGKFRQEPCTMAETGECEYCERGLKQRVVCGWLIFDYREFEVKERDENGNETGKKKTIEGNCKLLVRGKTDSLILAKLNTKLKGLSSRDFDVYKTGQDKSTRWNFTPGEATKLTEKKLASLMAGLPKKYEDLEPLEVVYANIFGMEEEEEEKPKRNESKREKLRQQEEDDEDDSSDEDDSEEDEDEDEPAPRKKAPLKNKSLSKKRTLGRRE